MWERKKNTKISGQKFLETNIGVKILKQKKSGKNIKRNPKIKKLEQNFGKIKKIANKCYRTNFGKIKKAGGELHLAGA